RRPTGCRPRPPPAAPTSHQDDPSYASKNRKDDGQYCQLLVDYGRTYLTAASSLSALTGARAMSSIPTPDDKTYPSDVGFSPSVKAIQSRKGSRQGYAQMEDKGSWKTRITEDLKAFIEAQTSVFLATANAVGQPYIQHRGGPAGFL